MERFKLLFTKVYVAVAVLSTLLMTSCDPAVTVNPSGWEKSGDKFVLKAGNITFEMGDGRMLGGETRYSPLLSITNGDTAALTITAARLKTSFGEYEGSTFDKKPWTPIEKGATATPSIDFHVQNTVHEEFKKSAVLTISYTIGSTPSVMEVELKKP